MTTTQEEPKIQEQRITVSIKLRLGTAEDFKIQVLEQHNDSVRTIIKPKIGQPFWLKSMIDGRVDNNHYQISEDTDWPEFKNQLRLGMVYVPVSFLELLEEKP